MKKKLTVIAILSLFSLASTAQVGNGQSKGVQIVPDIVTKNVKEEVIYDKVDNQIKKNIDLRDAKDERRFDVKKADVKKGEVEYSALAKPLALPTPASTPTPVDQKVLRVEKSDSTLNGLNKDTSKGVQVAKKPSTEMMMGFSDKMVPAAGVKIIEKIIQKHTTEKMVPPSDDLIYGALKAQGLRDGVGENFGLNTPTSEKAIVINAIQGVNEIVTIGRDDLNRFVTPFSQVIVRTAAGEEDLVSKVDGNIVYIGASKRSGVFLTEVGSDRAISLTLVPDDVPPRDIYLRLGKSSNIPSFMQKPFGDTNEDQQGSAPGVNGKSVSHVDYVKTGMRQIALGKLPSGFTMMRPKASDVQCNIPGFRMRLGQIIEGSKTKYLVYKAENLSNNSDATIDEQHCYRKGVVAVSAWPDVTVAPGAATEVFVLVNMNAEEEILGERPSLIGKD